jgi:hypothetical protein
MSKPLPSETSTAFLLTRTFKSLAYHHTPLSVSLSLSYVFYHTLTSLPFSLLQQFKALHLSVTITSLPLALPALEWRKKHAPLRDAICDALLFFLFPFYFIFIFG